MRLIFLLVLLALISSAGLAACGASPAPAPLAVTNRVTLVFIYTNPWPPWAEMKPIVDGLAEKYQEQVVTKRINANEGDGPRLMRDYRIPGHPTIIIFNEQGQEIQRFIGPQPAEAIEQVLRETLKES